MSDRTKIVAFLQNQYFSNPVRMKEIFELHYAGDREKFIRTFLFWSCLTGRRLRAAFGDDLCDHIVWENASPEIGGKSSSAFPADPAHMASVIRKHKPLVVLVFGKIAEEGLARALREEVVVPDDDQNHAFSFIIAPHPAARGTDVVQKLKWSADDLRTRIEWTTRVTA